LRVLTFGMVVTFGAYTVGSYGWVLLKGWDIPLRAWVSPLNPYQWPKDGTEPDTIPPAQLFPTGKGSSWGGNITAPPSIT
jgi:hypothetical protein